MNCQCTVKSIDHEPGACENTFTSTYLRDGIPTKLCLSCTLTGDVAAFTPEELAGADEAYAAAFSDWVTE